MSKLHLIVFSIINIISNSQHDEMTNQELTDKYYELQTDQDSMWLMICAFLVFYMHAGFAMVEMGTVRSKNAMNILIKNLLCITIATVVWQALGQGIAFGKGAGFVGTDKFAGTNDENQRRDWLFQWALCGTASTIVSGCLAERCNLWAQFIISFFLTGFVYPTEVHWTWASGGWLTEFGQTDFAGSGIVHMMGGVAGLIGAIFLGPRKGRFDPDTDPEEFRPHNVGIVTLGTLILWFGWYGFNGGSAMDSTRQDRNLVSIVSINTTLAGASGGLTVFFLKMAFDHIECVSALSNGLLAGLVSITAGCNAANSLSSLIIGVVGGIAQFVSVKVIDHLEIDDPLEAFSVHGACGVVGEVASGTVNVVVAGKEFQYFTGTLLGTFIIFIWVLVTSMMIFTPLWYFDILRVSAEEEDQGLDKVFHGGLGQQIGDTVRRQSTGFGQRVGALVRKLSGSQEIIREDTVNENNDVL